MSTPPPPGDDLEATVAMPRVTPLAPPLRVSPAAVAGPPAAGPIVPPVATVSPSVSPAAPVAVTAPRAPAVVAERPQRVFGNPFAYAFARLFAFGLDFALVSVVVTSLLYSMISVNPLTGLPTNTQSGFDATLALGAGIALVVVLVTEGLFGTTIGKLAFGLHVFAVRGGALGFGRAFVRMLLRPVDLLAIGFVLALLPGHRRLGDLLGGSVVARSRMGVFAPLIGWVLAILVACVPLILTGVNKTFFSLVAFAEFVPGIVGRIVALAQSLIGLAH